MASAMLAPCETSTSTCRSFATISSGLYLFLGISVLLDAKRHTSSRTTSMGVAHPGGGQSIGPGGGLSIGPGGDQSNGPGGGQSIGPGGGQALDRDRSRGLDPNTAGVLERVGRRRQ